MTFVGYLLAVLNMLAAGAFLYLAVMVYSARQTWSYLDFRSGLALNGMPVDKEDRDEKGEPRYLNLNDGLRTELAGSDKIETQEDALEARRREIQQRIENPDIKGAFGDPRRAGEQVPKYVEALLPLARNTVEREALFAQLSAKDPAKLAQQFEDHFKQAKEHKDPNKQKARDEKRAAIARLLVVLVDALPTEDEKKNANKPPNERSDPTAERTYQQMLGVVGTRAAAIALDEQASLLLEMASDVQASRDVARLRFADAHDAKLRQLESMDDRLQFEREQLAAKQKAATQAEALADAQKKEKEKVETALNQQRDVTAAQLKRLTEQQNELFKVRVLLRDANRINQQLEENIRTLERKTAKR